MNNNINCIYSTNQQVRLLNMAFVNDYQDDQWYERISNVVGHILYIQCVLPVEEVLVTGKLEAGARCGVALLTCS